MLAHELQVPAQTGHVLPARHGAGVEDDAGHRLVGRQPRVDGRGERIEVDPAQRCRGLDDHRARLLVEADGDARGLGQRGEPRCGLGAVTLGENAHRAGHEEPHEARRLPDPRDVADDGARVEQVQRPGAEPEVLPQRARGEAPVVGTHLTQDPQPSPRTLRLVDHRHDDAVVLVAGQDSAGADADHAGRHIRQDLDHLGASSQRGTGSSTAIARRSPARRHGRRARRGRALRRAPRVPAGRDRGPRQTRTFGPGTAPPNGPRWACPAHARCGPGPTGGRRSRRRAGSCSVRLKRRVQWTDNARQHWPSSWVWTGPTSPCPLCGGRPRRRTAAARRCGSSTWRPTRSAGWRARGGPSRSSLWPGRRPSRPGTTWRSPPPASPGTRRRRWPRPPRTPSSWWSPWAAASGTRTSACTRRRCPCARLPGAPWPSSAAWPGSCPTTGRWCSGSRTSTPMPSRSPSPSPTRSGTAPDWSWCTPCTARACSGTT